MNNNKKKEETSFNQLQVSIHLTMESLFRYFATAKSLLPLLVCWKIHESIALVPVPPMTCVSKPPTTSVCMGSTFQMFASNSEENGDSNTNVDDDNGEDKNGGEEETDSLPSPSIETSTLRIDDGGNDMTDRFKYKVHALMGDYDPTEGMVDDEDQDGNIMKALITFPTQHVFDVVGRLSTNDSDSEDYAAAVKSIVFGTTGDEEIACEIIPRGKKFVKVRCEATVESTTMINTIYQELGAMESTVMKF